MQFIAGMLGSMGVQGAVQVMHTTIPMEMTPNMGELLTQDVTGSAQTLRVAGKANRRSAFGPSTGSLCNCRERRFLFASRR